MPYITQDKRESVLDEIIMLVSKIRGTPDRNGIMNYTISELIRRVYGPNWRYTDINDVMGMLSSAQAEFYRKVAAPYEDIKARENGEVY